MTEHSAELSCGKSQCKLQGKKRRRVIQIEFFFRTFRVQRVRARYVSSLVSRSEAEARKNGCDARARGQRFTMETGAQDASKKGDHRGNGPDVGANRARRRARKGGFDNFLQFASRRHMPLNSRGLRRYKVYKDLRPSCTYVEVRIHIRVPRARGGVLHVARGCAVPQ